MINKLIQDLFKRAIKHKIPMPEWFVRMYIRTLSDDELMMFKFMCVRAKENN